MTTKYKTIAIDLDDTIAATTTAVIEYARQKLGKNLKLGDITSEAYWAQYGLSDRQAIDLVHGYNLEGFPGLQPTRNAVDVITRIAQQHELHILTSRDPVSEKPTLLWLKQYFPGVFTSVLLAGNQYVSKSVQSKAMLCANIKADIIIDDTLSHLVDCAAQGCRALLFGSYGWRPMGNLPANVVRVSDWVAVEEYLYAQR